MVFFNNIRGSINFKNTRCVKSIGETRFLLLKKKKKELYFVQTLMALKRITLKTYYCKTCILTDIIANDK